MGVGKESHRMKSPIAKKAPRPSPRVLAVTILAPRPLLVLRRGASSVRCSIARRGRPPHGSVPPEMEKGPLQPPGEGEPLPAGDGLPRRLPVSCPCSLRRRDRDWGRAPGSGGPEARSRGARARAAAGPGPGGSRRAAWQAAQGCGSRAF